MRKCPRCGITPQVRVSWCECGYRFDGTLQERLWRIDTNFYQGNLPAALNDPLLSLFGIQVVVSLLTKRQAALRRLTEWKPSASSVERHMIFDLHDNPNPEQTGVWRDCLDAIAESVRAGRRTFVHCTQGVSRSAIAAAFVYARLNAVATEQAIVIINENHRILGGWNPKLFAFLQESLPQP